MIMIYLLLKVALAQNTQDNLEELMDYSLVEGSNSVCSTDAYMSINLQDHSSLKFLLNTPKSHYRISFTFTLYAEKQSEMFFQINSNLNHYSFSNNNEAQYCHTQFAYLQYMELEFNIIDPVLITSFSISSDIVNNFVISYLKIYIYHCSKNCLQCQDYVTCIICMPNYQFIHHSYCVCPYIKPFQYNDQCLAQCPSGYYGFKNQCLQYINLENLFSDDQASKFIIINDYNTTLRNFKFYNDSQVYIGPLIQNEAILYHLPSPIQQDSDILIDFEVLFLDCNINQLLSFYLDDYLFDDVLIESNYQVATLNLVSFQNCVLTGYQRCFQVRVIYLIKEIQQLQTVKLKGNLPVNNQKMKWALSFMRIYKIELPVSICLKKQYYSQCVDKCPLTSKTIGNICQSITEEYQFSTIAALKYSDYGSLSEFTYHKQILNYSFDESFLQFYNGSYLFGGYKKWRNFQYFLDFNFRPHFKIKVYFKIILIDPVDSNDNFEVIFPNTNFIFSSSHPAAQCFNSLGSNGCNQQDQIGSEADDYLISFEEEIYHTDETIVLGFSCSSLSQQSQFYCALYDLVVLSIDCPLNCQKCTSSNDCLQFSQLDTISEAIYYECPEQGYYKNNGQCEQCPNYCEICTSSLNCLKCKDNYKMIGRECICLYNNVITYLTKCNNICHGSCSLCQSNSMLYSQKKNHDKLCAVCNSEEHKVLNVNVCICMDGYYMNYLTLPYSCLPCNQICLTCNELSNCLTCNIDQNRELSNNSCNCIKGYYEIDDSSICQQCDTLCKTCLNEINFCTSCYIEKFRILSDNNTCLCQQGFYEEIDKNCQKCNSLCETCSNFNSCLSCDENKFRIFQKQSCICFEGYYEDKLQECQRCYYSCSRCNNNNQYQCTQCPSTRVRSQQYIDVFDCLCKLGYYEIGDLQCSPCSQLQNPSKDHICYSKCGDKNIQWNEECDDGNQEQRDGCDQCLLPNSSCLDQNCLLCQFKQCVQCNLGYYLNYNFQCLKCSNNCLTCQSSMQNCLECKYLSKQSNVCLNCNYDYGFYEIDNKCLSICGDGIKTELEECDDSNILNGDGCNQYCQIEQGFKCVESCAKIQYLEMLLKENQFDSIYNSQRQIILYFNQEVEIIQIKELQSYINVEPMQKDLKFIILDIYISKSSQIVIKLEILSSYSFPQVSIQIINSTIIKDFQNYVMKDDLANFITLQDYYQQSQLNISAIENVINFNTSILYFMLLLVIIAFLFGGLEIFWNLLDTLQLICYLKYFNVSYPYNLQQYFQLFNFAEFDFIKKYFNIENYCAQYLSNSKAPSKFLNEGYSTVFLLNITSFVVVIMTTLISILAMKLFLYILMRQTKTISKLRNFNSKKQLHFANYLILTTLQKLENKFLKSSFYFLNAILRSYMCSAFDLNLAIFLQVSNIELTNTFLLVSSYFSIFFFIVQIIILHYGIQIINKIRISPISQFKYFKYQAFFEGVEVHKNIYVAYYNIFNQLKKILFTAFLVNLYYIPCFQIGLISTLSLSCSLFLYYKRPLSDRYEFIKQILTEIAFWIVQVVIIFISINELHQWCYYTTLEYIGWIIITLLNFILLIQLFLDIHQHFKYLSSKYQMLRKLKLYLCHIFDQKTNNENQFTFESDNSNWENNKFPQKILQNNRDQIQNRVLVCFTESANI